MTCSSVTRSALPEPAHFQPDRWDDVQERARRAELINDLMQNGGQDAREQLVSMLFAGRERLNFPSICWIPYGGWLTITIVHLINGLKAMINRRDYTQLLATLQLPTMVVGGEHDKHLSSPSRCDDGEAELPRCLGSDKLDGECLLSLELPQELSRKLVGFSPHCPPPQPDPGGRTGRIDSCHLNNAATIQQTNRNQKRKA